MNDCQHPLLVQYLQGAKVYCGACLAESADLMEVQAIHRGQTWKLILGFPLERALGSVKPARAFFGLTEGTVPGLDVAQAA